MRTIAASLALLVALGAVACSGDSTKEELADATEQDFEYAYRIEDQGITAQGFCAPALSVEQLLKDNDVWEEYGDRIKSIEVAKIEYRVPANSTPEDGTVELSVGEVAEFDPQEVETVARTQEIPALAPVTSFTRVNWIGSGRDTMSGYVADYQDDGGVPFFLCGLFVPTGGAEPADVSMTMDLIVTIKITVLPIG